MAEEGQMIAFKELLEPQQDLATQDGAFDYMRQCQQWAAEATASGDEIGIRAIIIGRKMVDGQKQGDPTALVTISDEMLDEQLESVGLSPSIETRKDMLANAIKGIAKGFQADAIVMINEASMVLGESAEKMERGEVPFPADHPDKIDIIFTTLEHHVIGSYIWVARVGKKDDKIVVGDFDNMGEESFGGRFCNLLVTSDS
jgi:hypothetical protein